MRGFTLGRIGSFFIILDAQANLNERVIISRDHITYRGKVSLQVLDGDLMTY